MFSGCVRWTSLFLSSVNFIVFYMYYVLLLLSYIFCNISREVLWPDEIGNPDFGGFDSILIHLELSSSSVGSPSLLIMPHEKPWQSLAEIKLNFAQLRVILFLREFFWFLFSIFCRTGIASHGLQEFHFSSFFTSACLSNRYILLFGNHISCPNVSRV